MALIRSNVSDWNHTSVVFIHGIGVQPKEFSLPLYQLLRDMDASTVEATRWYEIAYDSVNEAATRKLRLKKDVTSDFLLDLVSYLFTTDLYNWINTVGRKALAEVVQMALADNVDSKDHRVILISHSLGTVVSYELLHAILTDAQTLGITSNFRIHSWLTMGSPLAFIKKNEKIIPSLNNTFALRKGPISRPIRINTFTDEKQSNVLDWFNFQQKLDPVASLVPLTLASANQSLSQDTFVFDKLNTGINPHDFGNYLQEYADFLFKRIHA